MNIRMYSIAWKMVHEKKTLTFHQQCRYFDFHGCGDFLPKEWVFPFWLDTLCTYPQDSFQRSFYQKFSLYSKLNWCVRCLNTDRCMTQLIWKIWHFQRHKTTSATPSGLRISGLKYGIEPMLVLNNIDKLKYLRWKFIWKWKIFTFFSKKCKINVNSQWGILIGFCYWLKQIFSEKNNIKFAQTEFQISIKFKNNFMINKIGTYNFLRVYRFFQAVILNINFII